MKRNPIWDLLQNPSRQFEREMSALRLSAEEVFLECISVLDDVKENPKSADSIVQGLWNKEYCDLRDLDVNSATEKELQLGASILVYPVMLIAGLLEGTYYTRLTMSLMEQICTNSNDIYDRLQEAFMPVACRMGEEKLRTYIKDYMDSDDEWLSDDIMGMMRTIPIHSVVRVDDNKSIKEEKEDRLTNRQLIILFVQLLNVPLTSGYTNISGLAKLLAKVSGNKAESIRQKMMEQIDYDNKNVRRDVEFLASLIEPFSVKIATQLKNNISD